MVQTSSNQKIIQKADLALADITADGGLLNPEQANAFIRKLLVQPTILRQTRNVTMSSPQRKINKIQFATRILHPGVQGTALTLAQRSKPVTEQVLLTTSEVIAEIRIPYDVVEDNIERGNIGMRTDSNTGGMTGGIKDTIMDLIAERAALDLEELAILGDAASGDPYLALKDGFLVQSTQNTVDWAANPIDKTLFKQMMKNMPDQYLRSKNQMKHFVSTDNEIEYRDTITNRETALGDNQLVNAPLIQAYGVRVEPASLMPGPNALFANPQNFIFGIQRDIHIETDKDITERVYIIVLTARIDLKIEEVDAVVKAINIAP